MVLGAYSGEKKKRRIAAARADWGPFLTHQPARCEAVDDALLLVGEGQVAAVPGQGGRLQNGEMTDTRTIRTGAEEIPDSGSAFFAALPHLLSSHSPEDEHAGEKIQIVVQSVRQRSATRVPHAARERLPRQRFIFLALEALRGQQADRSDVAQRLGGASVGFAERRCNMTVQS